MPHAEILNSYVRRTHKTKGEDFKNFVFLSLVLRKYKNMLNNYFLKVSVQEKKIRELESKNSFLEIEAQQMERAISQLEETNNRLIEGL